MVEPSHSDEELALLQRSALRWAEGRFAPLQATLETQWQAVLPQSLYGELATLGWLPSAREELASFTALALARLGQALGGTASAAFLPALTHIVSAIMMDGCLSRAVAGAPLLLATSPYWDFSKSSSAVIANSSHGGVSLSGHLPMVVNAGAAAYIVVPSRGPTGEPMVCTVRAGASGLAMGEPIVTAGLRGVTARSLVFEETPADALVLQGERARRSTAIAARSLAWGAVGLLGGIVSRAREVSIEYARVRHQGGRAIIEHSAVARLLDRIGDANSTFELWLSQLQRAPEAEAPMTEARHLALRATDAALQVHGGMGYMCPGVTERCWRDARQVASLAWSKSLPLSRE